MEAVASPGKCPFGAPSAYDSEVTGWATLAVTEYEGHKFLSCMAGGLSWQARPLDGRTAIEALNSPAPGSSFSEPQPLLGGSAIIWGNGYGFHGVWFDQEVAITGGGLPDTASAEEVAAWFAANLPLALANAGS